MNERKEETFLIVRGDKITHMYQEPWLKWFVLRS